ncbi:hypothetical protein ACHAXT_013104 [Thalassiosira profunda]
MGQEPPGDDPSAAGDSYVGSVDLDNLYGSKPSLGSSLGGTRSTSSPTTRSGDTRSSAAHAASESSSMHHRILAEEVIECGSLDDDSLLPSPAREGGQGSPRIRLSRADHPLSDEEIEVVSESLPYGAGRYFRLSNTSAPAGDAALFNDSAFRCTLNDRAGFRDESFLDLHASAMNVDAAPIDMRFAGQSEPVLTEVYSGGYPDADEEEEVTEAPTDPTTEVSTAFRRTLTTQAAFHEESFADPVMSVMGRRGSFDTELPSVADPNESRMGRQLQLLRLKMSVNSGTEDSGRTRGTEELTDEDRDIEEEHYRELPPVETGPKVRPRGLEPEEYTGEETRLVVPGAEDTEERLEVWHSPGRPRNRSWNGPKKAKDEERMVVRKKVYPKERLGPQERQLAFAPEPPANRSEPYGGARHCFVTVEEEHRFLMLYTFLKRHANSKIVLFFATTKSTQYYGRLLRRLKFDARAIHNGMGKEKFTEAFLAFSGSEKGILCVPDFQGSDLAIPPTCDWIVQYEPPGDPSEYLLRVGRIGSAKVQGKDGERAGDAACQALLFLTPPQFGFLKYYKAARVRVCEYEIPKLSNVQKELERLLKEDEKLGRIALEAYRAYLATYASHEYGDIYNAQALDQRKVAKCFGFDELPSKDDAKKEVAEKKLDSTSDKENDREATKEDSPKRKKGKARDPGSRSFTGWKPKRSKEQTSWMKGEKTWKAANKHADKTKVKGGGWGKVPPEECKPRRASCVS